MFCINCGASIVDNSRFCNYCGEEIPFANGKPEEDALSSVLFCWQCGREIESTYSICPYCEAPQAQAGVVNGAINNTSSVEHALAQSSAPVNYQQAQGVQSQPRMDEKSKVAAGLLALLLGGLGIHKFYLGFNGAGGTMLAIWLVSFFIGIFLPPLGALGIMAVAIIALVEGIIYLTKSDRAFYETYVVGKKEWF